jgi:enoyl-CoA hydratase/carnithine racemase
MLTTDIRRIDHDGMVELVLDRAAARNAVNTGMLDQLRAQLEQLAKSPDLRVVVLSAAGATFCAGADLREFPAGTAPSATLPRLRLVEEVLRQLMTLEQPSISVVQGAAVGAGWGLALACDVCFATEDATFSLPELAKGYRLPPAIPSRLAQRVGPGRAAEMVLSGSSYSAQVGLGSGWVNRVLPDHDTALGNARALAASIARLPRAGVTSTMAAIRGITTDAVWQEE